MFIGGKTIEDLILQVLKDGSQETSELIARVAQLRPKVTKQGIYKSLRSLRADEVVVRSGKQLALSSVWLIRVGKFLDEARVRYGTQRSPSVDFLKLKDGERVSYWFRTLEETDMFWGHAFNLLSEVVGTHLPALLYNPHEWFFLARAESETLLFKKIKLSGRKLHLIVGNDTPLDRSIGKYFDGEALSIAFVPDFFAKPNYYMNAFGDFLIEVRLNTEAGRVIDDIYRTTKVFTPEAAHRIRSAIRTPGRSRLVISRNGRKAQRIRRLFSHHFLISSIKK